TRRVPSTQPKRARRRAARTGRRQHSRPLEPRRVLEKASLSRAGVLPSSSPETCAGHRAARASAVPNTALAKRSSSAISARDERTIWHVDRELAYGAARTRRLAPAGASRVARDER